MRYLLSRASRSVLTRLAHERTLCAFDFDGTLAPIIDNPDQAGLSSSTRSLLSQMAAVYPCVVLSGRARADLIGKLGGVGLDRVIGNHGAETEGIPGSTHYLVQRWKAALEVELGSLPGL